MQHASIPRKQTFVRFFFPGSIQVEERTQEVAYRDINNLTHPSGAFAFDFYDVYTVTHVVNGVPIELTSSEILVSATYFIATSTALWIEDALVRDVGHRRRLETLKREGYHQVVRCHIGGYQGFSKGDAIVAPREIFAK